MPIYYGDKGIIQKKINFTNANYKRKHRQFNRYYKD
jgi:hypothetical protein